VSVRRRKREKAGPRRVVEERKLRVLTWLAVDRIHLLSFATPAAVAILYVHIGPSLRQEYYLFLFDE
jgi:hypothetical protein